MKVLRVGVVAAQVFLGIVLVLMAAPGIPTIRDQVASGYVPDDYGMFVFLVALPFVITLVIAAGTFEWARGSRLLLVVADVLAVVACWTALILFVFNNDWPLVALGASPVALVLAVLVPPPAASVRDATESRYGLGNLDGGSKPKRQLPRATGRVVRGLLAIAVLLGALWGVNTLLQNERRDVALRHLLAQVAAAPDASVVDFATAFYF